MGLHLRYGTAATAGAALIGLSIYAVFKSGALRPVLVGAIRGGMKAANWAGQKAECLRKGVSEMVEEAKFSAKPAAKPVAKPVAKSAAKSAAKPAPKTTPKAAETAKA